MTRLQAGGTEERTTVSSLASLQGQAQQIPNHKQSLGRFY